jgi:hypothetical protein
LTLNCGAGSPSFKSLEARQDNDRRHGAAKLVNIAQSPQISSYGIPANAAAKADERPKLVFTRKTVMTKKKLDR